MGLVVVASPYSGGGGGVSSVIRNQIRELAKSHQVILVSSTLPKEPIPGVQCICTVGHKFTWLGRFGHVPRELSLAVASWRICHDVCSKRPVNALIVHSHLFSAMVGWRLWQKFGVPCLLVVHADVHERPKGTYDPLLTILYRWITPIAYRHANGILAISQAMARMAILHGAEARRVCVVPNGISLSEIGLEGVAAKPAVAQRNGVLRLLYVGRLSVEKGVADLIRACRLLKRQDAKFLLSIVGDGPLKNELERMVSEMGIHGYVRFLGIQPRNRLGALYQAADITCVPSLSEPQGIVVLESLIAGTPVVASNVGGIPDMVKDHVNGRLHPPGNPEAIAEILVGLMQDRTSLRNLAMSARPSVENEYSWPAIGVSLRTAIDSVVSRQNC